MDNFTHHPDYDKLPDIIKYRITPKEFAWLTDGERDRFLEDELYPDPEDFE